MFCTRSALRSSTGCVLRCALALAVCVVFARPVEAGDAAQDLNTTLQKARSRMLGMQIDDAVSLFRDATKQIQALKGSEPDHARLPDLEKKYGKLAADLAKKVLQRAGRDINPMRSALESAMATRDADRVRAAREKLDAAVAKHRSNLESAGGLSGLALLSGAQQLLQQAAAGGGDSPTAGGTPSEPAETAPTEPSPPPTGDAKQIFGEIQRAFRSASGMRTPELVEAAVGIRALIGQLRAADPNHPRLTSFEQKIDQLVADAYAGDVRRAQGEIDRRISRIEMYLERNQENERPQLREQRELLAKALEDHLQSLTAAGPEGQALVARTEAALAAADARIGAALEGDSLVRTWWTKLKAYVAGGDKDITPGINGAALYAKVKEWRAEAEDVLAAYRQVEFAKGKTRELERAEESLEQAFKDADYNLKYAVTSRAEKAAKQAAWITEVFAGDHEWRRDRSKPPTRFADDLLDELGRRIVDLAEYQSNHPALGKLRAEHTRLLKENGERRDAAKAQTYLEPDRYVGADAARLKTFARARVPADHPGATALRVTIFTPAWSEESVVEWTDSTKTAIRSRTTRTLKFSVAFKDQTGVSRDIGYLNQDRKRDGTWGPVYGHLAKYKAPMLEKNVAK